MHWFVKIPALLLLFCMSLPSHADERNAELVQSTEKAIEQARAQESKASEWGISVEDWRRYQSIMEGPRGVFSPGLDPISALGIEARSDEERLRYARLQARLEMNRVEKELAYQRAYDSAIAELVAGQNRVNLKPSRPQMSPITQEPSPTGDGRLALFVSENCRPCGPKAAELQKSGVSFDIYLVDSDGDDERVRKWAMASGIDPGKVRSRQITLNHDEGRWSALQKTQGASAISGPLPATLRMANGRWISQ